MKTIRDGKCTTMNIRSINSETPAAFVKRNGPTLTHEIGIRFGLDVREALKVMKKLERAGEVKSRRVAFDYGAGLEWTVQTTP